MENEFEQVGRLNYAIEKTGHEMSPSQAALFYYGPIKEIISDANLSILEANLKDFKKRYYNSIFPKTKYLVRGILGKNIGFPETKKELDDVFRHRSPEEVRKKLRDSYKEQFVLDETTRRRLFSDEKIPNLDNEEVRFYFDKTGEYIFHERFKKEEKTEKKLEINFRKKILAENKKFLKKCHRQNNKNFEIPEELIRDSKIALLNSAVFIAEKGPQFWDRYSVYFKMFGQKSVDMYLHDIVGFTMIYTDLERSERRMDYLVKNYDKIDFRAFSVVRERVKDQRKRRRDGRPGGIHFTFTGKKSTHCPLEFKFRSIEDACADFVGEHSDGLYDLRGKKDNPQTPD